MADSCSNSSVGSPYASSTDLRGEDSEEIMERGRRRSRNLGSTSSRRAVGGLDLEDVENTVRGMQQDYNDMKTEFTGIRNQSQSQKRRILDLENQFEDARVRIDKLLQRKSIRRNTYDSVSNSSSFVTPSASFTSERSSHSSKMNIDRSDSMDSTSSTELHKTQININPANNTKQTFGTVTLTVKVDED